MSDIYWLEQMEVDVPVENDWLGATEVYRLDDMRFAKRRSDWRLGRWTAKRALALCLNLPHDYRSLSEIEIRAARTGAPEVFLKSRPVDISISLSHRSGRAMCAITSSLVALGCDVEEVEPRSDAFITDYFAAQEQTLVLRSRPADRNWLLALLWSAKESALKALHAGLRLDTRSVVVTPVDGSPNSEYWYPLEVRHVDGALFYGWWQLAGNFIWTMVCDSPSRPPVRLQAAAFRKEVGRCA